jgi:PiT family inorganic phosphate transporter
METVGGSLLKLSPEAALVVVLAHSLVLFFFASEELEYFLVSQNLPAFPLVPVSSSQAIVGAIVGIGLLRSWRSIKFRVLGHIAFGWISTPIAAGLITYVSLFFMQNVFNQTVSKETEYQINPQVMIHLESLGIYDAGLEKLAGKSYKNSTKFRSELEKETEILPELHNRVIDAARKDSIFINSIILNRDIDREWFSSGQLVALQRLENRSFNYSWQLTNELDSLSVEWRLKSEDRRNKKYNNDLLEKRRFIIRLFRIEK